MAAKAQLNPWEELTESLGDAFVDLVYELVDEFAPVRPWWEQSLTADQQLWRYIFGPSNTPEDGTRAKILPWIIEAGVWMGAETAPEALRMIEDMFMKNPEHNAEDLIPLRLQASVPVELVEIVQAVGAPDAAKHIRQMERMIELRQPVVSELAQAAASQPQIPATPPPLPIEAAPNTAGWPLYGEAPVNAGPVFSG